MRQEISRLSKCACGHRNENCCNCRVLVVCNTRKLEFVDCFSYYSWRYWLSSFSRPKDTRKGIAIGIFFDKMKGVCILWHCALASKKTHIKSSSLSQLYRSKDVTKERTVIFLFNNRIFSVEIICWLVLREISKIIRYKSILLSPTPKKKITLILNIMILSHNKRYKKPSGQIF